MKRLLCQDLQLEFTIQDMWSKFLILIVLILVTATQSTDHYKVLGVSPQADSKTIAAAWRALNFAHHPNYVGVLDAEGERKLGEISRAYETLSDPIQRAAYDELLAAVQEAEEGAAGLKDDL